MSLTTSTGTEEISDQDLEEFTSGSTSDTEDESRKN
jgi:hypothetical protein